jgi:hypothetical protein
MTDAKARCETERIAATYNATTFPVESDVEDFANFPHICNVGTTAPDTQLTDLDSGDSVSLRDITRNGLTILEFGSLT